MPRDLGASAPDRTIEVVIAIAKAPIARAGGFCRRGFG